MNQVLQEALETYTGEYRKALKNMIETLLVGELVLVAWCMFLTSDWPKWEWLVSYGAFVGFVYFSLLVLKARIVKSKRHPGE